MAADANNTYLKPRMKHLMRISLFPLRRFRMVSFDHIRPVFLGWCPFWKLLPTAPGPHPPGVAVGPGGTPPSPLVSLSGAKSFGIFGLQVVLAFTRLILNGLRVKVGKHWG